MSQPKAMKKIKTYGTYTDVKLEEVKEHYDILQPKIDGWFVQLNLHQEGEGVYSCRIHSSSNRLLLTRTIYAPLCTAEFYVLYGEYIYGTNWAQQHPEVMGSIVVYDIRYPGPYYERYRRLVPFVEDKRNQLMLIQNFPTAEPELYWQALVEKNGHEGLIFRRTTDPRVDIGRCKKAHQAVYRVAGFQEGEGKYQNTLGALIIETRQGVKGSVGGFTDRMRAEVWLEQEAYLGRFVECEGKALFTTGLLRHPQFKAWKEPGYDWED